MFFFQSNRVRSRTSLPSGPTSFLHQSSESYIPDSALSNGEGDETAFQYPPTNFLTHSTSVEPPRPPPKRISNTFLRTVLDRPRAETFSASSENFHLRKTSADHIQDPSNGPQWQHSHLYPTHCSESIEDPWYPQQLSPRVESSVPPLPRKVSAATKKKVMGSLHPDVILLSIFSCLILVIFLRLNVCAFGFRHIAIELRCFSFIHENERLLNICTVYS